MRQQRVDGSVEVVAVDNASTDGSRAIAERYADKVLDIWEYRPGAALNRSIEACTGDCIVALSAHALPANDSWLASLTAWLRHPDVLGVYGAQIYPATSRFLDKRDLDMFSELRPRTERSDSDFWNANSCFQRDSWEEQPFDETTIELEDHYWTKQLLPGSSRWVRFEPTSVVYHYGHEARNDREFLPPSPLTDDERIDEAIGVLLDDGWPWPAVMSAGLTLGTFGPVADVSRAVPAVGRCLLHHSDFDVRWRMAAALGRIRSRDSADFLVAGLNDSSFYPRDESAWSLARLGELAVPRVIDALDSMAEPTLPFAALALGLSGLPEAEEVATRLLGRCMASDDDAVRRDAIYFLGELRGVARAAELAEAVTARLCDSDDIVRAAAWCCGRLTAGKAASIDAASLLDLARCHPLETVRAEAILALGQLTDARASHALLQEVGAALARDPAGRVRYAAMQALRLVSRRHRDAVLHFAGQHTSDEDHGVMFERTLIVDQRPPTQSDPETVQ